MSKVFLNSDPAVVSKTLDEVNAHFGFPTGAVTKTYSRIFTIDAGGHSDDGKSGFPVKTSGLLDVSPVLSEGDLTELDPTWFPEPVEEEEEESEDG